jgi:hypothetical protein
VNERAGLTGHACTEHHGWPTLEPLTRHLTQRFKEIGVAPVKEDEPVIYGLSVHSTRRTTTAYPTRTLEQANPLSRVNEHLGTGQAGDPCTDDDYI